MNYEANGDIAASGLTNTPWSLLVLPSTTGREHHSFLFVFTLWGFHFCDYMQFSKSFFVFLHNGNHQWGIFLSVPCCLHLAKCHQDVIWPTACMLPQAGSCINSDGEIACLLPHPYPSRPLTVQHAVRHGVGFFSLQHAFRHGVGLLSQCNMLSDMGI